MILFLVALFLCAPSRSQLLQKLDVGRHLVQRVVEELEQATASPQTPVLMHKRRALHVLLPVLNNALSTRAFESNRSAIERAVRQRQWPISRVLFDICHTMHATADFAPVPAFLPLQTNCLQRVNSFLSAADELLRVAETLFPFERQSDAARQLQALLNAATTSGLTLADEMLATLRNARWAHSCVAANRRKPQMRWHDAVRLLKHAAPPQLHSPLNFPFVLFFFRGDNDCVFSATQRFHLDRVIRQFPTVHIFEVYAHEHVESYFSLRLLAGDAEVQLPVSIRNNNDAVDQMRDELVALPLLMLFRIESNTTTKFVSTNSLIRPRSASIARWLTRSTGIPPLIVDDDDDNDSFGGRPKYVYIFDNQKWTVEDKFWFAAAALFLVVQIWRKNKK